MKISAPPPTTLATPPPLPPATLSDAQLDFYSCLNELDAAVGARQYTVLIIHCTHNTLYS
jgi:hypothetical protein